MNIDVDIYIPFSIFRNANTSLFSIFSKFVVIPHIHFCRQNYCFFLIFLSNFQEMFVDDVNNPLNCNPLN